MPGLNESTSGLVKKPFKPPQQSWVPSNAALSAALTRIENALDIIERLADAIEKHLGTLLKEINKLSFWICGLMYLFAGMDDDGSADSGEEGASTEEEA